MTADSELLQRFVGASSEEAFAELVRRYVNLVYSAALRQVNGDTQLAQEVAQTVFIDLARKATTLLNRPRLSGWLYTSTHFAATKAVRTESRRRAREQEAHAMHVLEQDSPSDLEWGKLRPVLDSVMHELNDGDRDLLLMRFFENQKLGPMGTQLGLSEDATRKRVDRALEKLRSLLAQRGIATTSTLSAAMSAGAVQMAPPGLALKLTTASLTATAFGTATGITTMKIIGLTKAKLGIVGALAIAGLAIPVLYQQQARLRWQAENELLKQRLAELQNANQGLSNQIAGANAASAVSQQELSELLRLRGEVSRLGRQLKGLEELSAENRQLRRQPSAGDLSPVAPAPSRQAPFQIRLVVDGQLDDAETITNRSKTVDAGDAPEALYVDKTPLMDSASVQSVKVSSDASGAPQIEIDLTEKGRVLFASITKENLNKRLAIVMDGQSYLAPTVRDEITGGKIQLTGTFSEEQARELASKINEAISSR